MSRDVRGLRPNRSWKGVIAGGRDEFGMVGLIQQFAATYSFQRVGHALHSSDNTSCIHAPHSSHTTLTPRLIGRVELYPHLSPTTKVFSITAAVTSPPPSALMNEDTPNVRHKSRRRRATSWAPFKERGVREKELGDALSPTSSKYSLSALGVLGMFCIYLRSRPPTARGTSLAAFQFAGYVIAC